MSGADLEGLQERLGYRFGDDALLVEALTHSTYSEENAASADNQRLEFLGDAVASLVVARGLFVRRPEAREGQLTKLRVALVDGPALAAIGRSLDLDSYLRIGVGEGRKAGKARATREEDAVEALLGAVFLDRGFDEAAVVFERLLQDHWEVRPTEHPKAALNELCIKRFGGITPTFFGDSSTGSPDQATWTSYVRLPDDREFEGIDEVTEAGGGSKKRARINAAAAALAALRDDYRP